ncbi:hypothetical protein [Kitasatospora sp. NBC_01539]|uniref:hypothetical protein n=1 Tax=Kitasatospora sp. NBC_01539 TaxID=2903577 RepID=UPI0038601888
MAPGLRRTVDGFTLGSGPLLGRVFTIHPDAATATLQSPPGLLTGNTPHDIGPQTDR